MASIQSKFVYTLIRWSWLHNEKLNNENLSQIRKRFINGKLGKLLFSPSGVSLNKMEIEGVEVEEFRDKDDKNSTNKIILYAHGGGFIFERAYTHLSFLSYLAHRAKVKIISVNYNLAPEHPFPTQINELEKVYLYLLQKGHPLQDIFFAGDSAGANLVISTALLLKKNKKKLPKGIILISPTTDGTFAYHSFNKNQKTETMLSQEKMRFFYDSYKGKKKVTNSLISPVFADLKELPKTQIFVSDSELLFDDAMNFYKKLKKADVKPELHIGKGLFHGYPLLVRYMPEANSAINKIVEFIKT